MDDRTAGRLELRGPRLVLRSPRQEDRAAIASTLGGAGVVRWWGPPDDDHIDELVADADDDLTPLVIERDGIVIGLIQFSEEDDPMYRNAGIDLAIDDDHQGQGYGPEAIDLVIDHLAAIGHHRIVIDPNAENERAIAAYGRLGFRRVGLLRDYEWSDHHGRWSDGLLMELLIAERPARPPAGGGR